MAGKEFDVLIYPEERHMPRSEGGRRHMETEVVEYFRRGLQDSDRGLT